MERSTTRLEYVHITKLQFGGQYELTLAMLAGLAGPPLVRENLRGVTCTQDEGSVTNALQSGLEIMKDEFFGESEDAPCEASEVGVPPCIWAVAASVRRAVDLNDESELGAGEVGDVSPDDGNRPVNAVVPAAGRGQRAAAQALGSSASSAFTG